MRLPLQMLEIFNAIIREGSFTRAAQKLGVRPSTISHQLKALEQQLGTDLIVRTTRSMQLTEAGHALVRGTGPAFDQLTDAINAAQSVGDSPRGSLRLTMSDFVYAVHVRDALPAFCATYPDIEVEMSFTDALSDLLDEELHAGFRLGGQIAPDMIAVRLSHSERLAVLASNSYLARKGVPQTPEDLLDHDCIRYRFPTSRQIAPWTFRKGDQDYTIAVHGRHITNTLPSVVDLALQHYGLIFTFRDYCTDEIDRGVLTPVLEDHVGMTPGTFIYFPREYGNMVPLRLFVEHMKAHAMNR